MSPKWRHRTSIKCLGAVCVQHMFLRIYASLHLALMSAAVVSGLPAMGDRLHRFLPDDWLQSLGLWNPSVSHSIVPVLILLLMVRSMTCLAFHANGALAFHSLLNENVRSVRHLGPLKEL